MDHSVSPAKSGPPFTDDELKHWFQLIAQGDESAFTSVFLRCSAYMFPFASMQLHNEEEARDLVQEAFMNLWLYRSLLATVENPRAYLYRMIYNGLMRKFGKLKKQYEFLRAFEEEQQLQLNIQPNTNYADLQARFARAVAELPEERRRIFLLKQEGLKVNEIATELGISPNTVKTQLKRAFASLRDQLKEDGLPLVFFLTFLR